jgi:Chaperone of endosialidase
MIQPQQKMKSKNTTTLHLRKSINRSPLRHGFLLITLALGCFALSPTAKAVSPPPDGGYPNANTAEGDGALFSLTPSAGYSNTAIGYQALYSNIGGDSNTAVGQQALLFNTYGIANTAMGYSVLGYNTTGASNTAVGIISLHFNTTGANNTAIGREALYNNTTGGFNTGVGFLSLKSNTTTSFNTAIGVATLLANTANANTATGAAALLSNTTGPGNTANGTSALLSNTTGSGNTAVGSNGLLNSTTGSSNTAIGRLALASNTTGSYNIALGQNAGQNLTTGDSNIDIGNTGVTGENSTIRIGDSQSASFIAGISGTAVMGNTVVVDANGRLGTATSSARFKHDIKPMDKASEALLALTPVTFRYKKEIDPDGVPQFGLIAEDVEKANPALITRDAHGKPFTVRYESVNAMLLNEFLKEHHKVQEQEARIKQLESTVSKQEAITAQQQKGMDAVTARLNEQATQIQKVSAQIEISKAVGQTALNKP